MTNYSSRYNLISIINNNYKSYLVAVTIGLLNILDYDELEAVIGHEFSHINNREKTCEG